MTYTQSPAGTAICGVQTSAGQVIDSAQAAQQRAASVMSAVTPPMLYEWHRKNARETCSRIDECSKFIAEEAFRQPASTV